MRNQYSLLTSQFSLPRNVRLAENQTGYNPMSYSDFTLKRINEELNLDVVEDRDLFSNIREIQISEYLSAALNYNVPIAMAVGTEKVRSELIIANVLLEVRRISDNKISFFSGVNLDVDREKGLTGFCDFIISRSKEQFYIKAPVVTVVEAKNEYIAGGLGQCIAEMYASDIFNEREGSRLPAIYGAVTTGNTWKFLKYADKTAYIDLKEYYIVNVNKIVGVLIEMVNQSA